MSSLQKSILESKVIEALKTMPGHVESHLYEDVATVGSYVILSRWETKQSYEAFLRSDAFKSAVSAKDFSLGAGDPKHFSAYLKGRAALQGDATYTGLKANITGAAEVEMRM